MIKNYKTLEKILKKNLDTFNDFLEEDIKIKIIGRKITRAVGE